MMTARIATWLPEPAGLAPCPADAPRGAQPAAARRARRWPSDHRV